MILPISVDKTPDGKIVPAAQIGQPGYGENTEYFLIIHPGPFDVTIEYLGEDGKYLKEREIAQIIKTANGPHHPAPDRQTT